MWGHVHAAWCLLQLCTGWEAAAAAGMPLTVCWHAAYPLGAASHDLCSCCAVQEEQDDDLMAGAAAGAVVCCVC